MNFRLDLFVLFLDQHHAYAPLQFLFYFSFYAESTFNQTIGGPLREGFATPRVLSRPLLPHLVCPHL